MLIFFATFAMQMKMSTTTNRLIVRKVATLFLVIASFAAFATLGDGNKDGGKKNQRNLLSTSLYKPDYKTFSLKSRYNYRGNNIFSAPPAAGRFIMLNTVVTYQRGNTTYILPMKKKVLLDKIKFNPAH